MEFGTSSTPPPGKIALALEDGAALVVGHLLLRWGHLDFQIENLLEWLWRSVADSAQQENQPVPPKPKEGRATYRVTELRRYFAIVCENDRQALSQFDNLRTRYSATERIRSTVAHGMPIDSIKDGVPLIGAWIFTTSKDGGEPVRKDEQRFFTFDQIEDASKEADAIREELQALIQTWNRSFIITTMARHAAKS